VDRDRVEAARAGDREAYADLIRVRGDRLYALAQRILRDVDRAEDALQEALVIAWRDLAGLRDPDRFDAWLHRLVVRACLAEAARERRRFSNLRVLPMDVPTATDDFLNVVDRDQLERGFRRLSPQQRALLVLRHFEGRDLGEIAEILGIPVGTARSRLHHAHGAMRAALDADARAIAVGGRPA
jgi:RNA polymerase sigma-70 factor, ECF subfamily